ncbi:glutathione-disulfide reductase [Pseudoxanthomonas yeongjuensis]|uniref:glutathione-disulfide reductase n=1 Tax=Pseudoxanthomonas yeongjuensis TaxID=377616 RepID=UPI0013909713|nr:glutathione-disulfide reductase [Pseudoxanthomonas yeongjuensis]KAF1714410.1 glutathione-disulfide reductase [Pseudoxanthomonas yeongjuensis]
MSARQPDYDYDLVVIGGGSGGLAGAFRAASHGARVALLEPGEFGGTCVNVGCVPKKAMWLAAELSQRIDMASRLGFDLPPPKLDWREFIVHRQRYIAGIHDSYRKRLDAAGIVHMPCRGHFVDAHTVETHQGLRVSAAHVLIATGGKPRRPDIPGAELGLVSDDFFSLCDAPGRVAIVGGGYIAVELAGVLQALGSKVEVFVRGSRLLDSFDVELSDELAENLRQHGIHCHFADPVAAIEQVDEKRLRVVEHSGRAGELFDSVIFATGRVPNSDRLGLDDIGVSVDGGGFVVVDALQDTSLANVHAVGDVSSRLALTPVAIAAARRLMDRLFGGQPEARLDYRDIATVVFSHPPLGMVGLCEAEARERHGDAVKVYTTRFRPMLHALADSPQRSLFKLVCVGEEERVVGIHLLGEGVDEMLQGFAVALKKGITKRDLDDTMAIHPTSAEEVVLMR